MAHSRKNGYFINLKAEQSTAENNWVVTIWVVTFFFLHYMPVLHLAQKDSVP